MKAGKCLVLVAGLMVGCGDGLFFDLVGPNPDFNPLITADVPGDTAQDGAREERSQLTEVGVDVRIIDTVDDRQDATDVLLSLDVLDASDVADDSPDGLVLADAADVPMADVLDATSDDRPDVTMSPDLIFVDQLDVAAETAVDTGPRVDIVDVPSVTDVPMDMGFVDVLPDHPPVDTGADVPSEAAADVPADVAMDTSAPADVRDVVEEEAPPPIQARILFDHMRSGIPFFTDYLGTDSDASPPSPWYQNGDLCQGGIRTTTYESRTGWSQCLVTIHAVHGPYLFFSPSFCREGPGCDEQIQHFRVEYNGRILRDGDVHFVSGCGPIVGFPHSNCFRINL